jgi:hypothetical protein
MILKDTAYGYKQKLVIGGINSFDVFSKNLNVVFHVEISDPTGVKVVDNTILQDRKVVYSISNFKKVDAQFNPVTSGGSGEYDFFMNLLNSTPLPALVLQLATKLNERGIFN